MASLDWEEIWTRLKGMLWSAGALGLAGLAAGGWVYGFELHRAHQYGPQFYRTFHDPAILGEWLRRFAGWVDSENSWEMSFVHLLWFAGVLWVYLIPEVPRRHRLGGLLGGIAGLVAAFLIDKGTGHWGERDLWVRFGVLLGCGIFLGTGLALREKGRKLLSRVIRGGLSAGYIGLVYGFAAEIELLGYAAGVSPGIRAVLPPAICGMVIGLTLRGGELLLAGPVPQQWQRYWPLILLALMVLFNAVGPVLLVQHWFVSGQL